MGSALPRQQRSGIHQMGTVRLYETLTTVVFSWLVLWGSPHAAFVSRILQVGGDEVRYVSFGTM